MEEDEITVQRTMSGLRVLITGAGGGIGAATAKAFAAQGALGADQPEARHGDAHHRPAVEGREQRQTLAVVLRRHRRSTGGGKRDRTHRGRD